jgi:hypothetical protein
VGREASLAALKFQFDMFDPIVFRLRNLAVDDNVVLTERVDEITTNDIAAPVPVMGTFAVRDGRIVAWRDYFDLGSLAGSWPVRTSCPYCRTDPDCAGYRRSGLPTPAVEGRRRKPQPMTEELRDQWHRFPSAP